VVTDQAVHNYIVRMRPLPSLMIADCWLRPCISCPTIHADDAAGVLIDGRLVPSLHQWDRSGGAASGSAGVPAVLSSRGDRTGDAIVAFYHRPRDANRSRRSSAVCVARFCCAYCVGAFDAVNWPCLHGLGVWRIGRRRRPGDGYREFRPPVHQPRAGRACGDERGGRPGAGAGQRPGGFQRDPFQARTIGLSVFCEGPAIGESE
jgi:hypothetical protein